MYSVHHMVWVSGLTMFLEFMGVLYCTCCSVLCLFGARFMDLLMDLYFRAVSNIKISLFLAC